MSALFLLLILAVLFVVALAALFLVGAACLLLLKLLMDVRTEEEGDKEAWVPIDDLGGETWVPLIRSRRGPPRDREEAGR